MFKHLPPKKKILTARIKQNPKIKCEHFLVTKHLHFPRKSKITKPNPKKWENSREREREEILVDLSNGAIEEDNGGVVESFQSVLPR